MVAPTATLVLFAPTACKAFTLRHRTLVLFAALLKDACCALLLRFARIVQLDMSFRLRPACSAQVSFPTASTVQAAQPVFNALLGTLSMEEAVAQVAALRFLSAFTAQVALNAQNVKEDTISME